MSQPSPRLEIFTKHIEENANSIIGLCHQHGMSIACVTKVVMAHPEIAAVLEAAGADILADSRIPNLKSISEHGTACPVMALRIPAPSAALDVVRYADISLNSSLYTLELLSQAAAALKKQHQIIIMVELGDLREGVLPERAPAFIKAAAKLPRLHILGLGANLMCYGGVIPTVENMHRLVEVREACRKTSGLELPVLSGGNSANLPLLLSGKLPKQINQLRIGEAIMLGGNVLDGSALTGTRQDTFRVVAAVIEVERKPSIPIGTRGPDAFGGFVNFVDRGNRLRAICNIWRQDVRIDGLTHEDAGIIVLGGSSDHLILDVEEAAVKVEVGSEIGFLPNYAALLAASTSPYVQKVVINN